MELTIPIFPLPVVVLFPEGRAPLHIFEPRYCQMMEAALSEEGLIGMVAVPEEHQTAMSGDPPLYPVGCAGRVSHYQRLADGRFNLALEATERFRIIEEPPRPPDQLYRRARIASLPEVPGDSGGKQLPQRRREIMEVLTELVAQNRSGPGALDSDALDAKSDSLFINNLCQSLGLPTTEKQGLLEIDSILERADRLLGHLTFHLASLRSGGPSRSVH